MLKNSKSVDGWNGWDWISERQTTFHMIHLLHMTNSFVMWSNFVMWINNKLFLVPNFTLHDKFTMSVEQKLQILCMLLRAPLCGAFKCKSLMMQHTFLDNQPALRPLTPDPSPGFPMGAIYRRRHHLILAAEKPS